MINKKELAIAIAHAANLTAKNINDRLLVSQLSIFIQEASLHLGSHAPLNTSSLAYAASALPIKEANGGKSLFEAPVDGVVDWQPSVMPSVAFERVGLCGLRATN